MLDVEQLLNFAARSSSQTYNSHSFDTPIDVVNADSVSVDSGPLALATMRFAEQNCRVISPDPKLITLAASYDLPHLEIIRLICELLG